MELALCIDREALAEVCRRYGVAELAVFGSVARGEATGASDIDITYVLAPRKRLGWEIEDLADELSTIFGRRVDLVSRRALHPPYRRSGDRRVPGAVCGVILDEVIEAGERAVAIVHERSADEFRAELNARDALLWNVIVIVLGSARSREECGSPLRDGEWTLLIWTAGRSGQLGRSGGEEVLDGRVVEDRLWVRPLSGLREVDVQEDRDAADDRDADGRGLSAIVTHENVAGGVAVIADVAEVELLTRSGGVPEVGGATETGGDVVAQGCERRLDLRDVAGEQALLHDEAVSCPFRGENLQVLDELSECLPLQVCGGPRFRAGVLAEGRGRQSALRVFRDEAGLAFRPIAERRVGGLRVIVEVRRGDEEVGQVALGEDFGRRRARGARATWLAAAASSVKMVGLRG